MLEGLRASADGHFSNGIRLVAQLQAPSRLEEMIVGAIRNWEAENYHAFAADEHSFNIRICDHMQRIKRAGGFTWALVSVTLETGYPTAEQLAGNADPRKLKRPDIVARFGGNHEMHIEAKRVDASRALSQAYVQKGLRRFIDGGYTHDPFGTMIGYVISSDPAAVLSEINARILEEADLTASDKLRHRATPTARLSQHRSDHKAGACVVNHHHVHMN